MKALTFGLALIGAALPLAALSLVPPPDHTSEARLAGPKIDAMLAYALLPGPGETGRADVVSVPTGGELSPIYPTRHGAAADTFDNSRSVADATPAADVSAAPSLVRQHADSRQRRALEKRKALASLHARREKEAEMLREPEQRYVSAQAEPTNPIAAIAGLLFR